MVSAVCFLLMLLIVIILPTILYTLFFLFNCPLNPLTFFQNNNWSQNSGEIMGIGNSKMGDQIEEKKSNNKNNNMELIKMSTNLNLGNDLECPICLSVFQEGEEIKQVKICKHLFHINCIDKWLSTHFNCPVCRAFVTNYYKVKKDNYNIRRLASTSGDHTSDLWQGLPDSSGLV